MSRAKHADVATAPGSTSQVRFDATEGLRRDDIVTAAEIWLSDLCAAVWATPDAMKLGAYLVRSMIAPTSSQLQILAIQAHIQLDRDEVRWALRLLQLYRAVEAFVMEENEIQVALHLSSIQRLRALEIRHRLARLSQTSASGQPHWLPVVESDDDRPYVISA